MLAIIWSRRSKLVVVSVVIVIFCVSKNSTGGRLKEIFCCCQKGLGLLDLRELFPCSRLSKIVYLLTLVSILARPEKRTGYRRDFGGVLLHSPIL
jgi:hypothetical protein